MRLWHVDLIGFLPRGQLLAQWRELNSIFAKQDQHILINYTYEYPKEDLYIYSKIVMDEMTERGYKIRTLDKMERYFEETAKGQKYQPFSRHHNFEYLEICYFNLKEKFLRGQKDYDEKSFMQLLHYYKQQLENEK